MDRVLAKRIIEALLFASERPLSIEEMRQALDGEVGRDVRAFIDELKNEYESEGRSFHIVEIASGFQVCTRPDFAPWLKKLHRSRRINRFSKPALETLAVVAYRQPVTRSEVESVRGVNVEGVLRMLLEKGMVRIKGRKKSPGRPIIYGTTGQFLEFFGLNSLSQLPQLEDVAPPEGEEPASPEREGAGEVKEGASSQVGDV